MQESFFHSTPWTVISYWLCLWDYLSFSCMVSIRPISNNAIHFLFQAFKSVIWLNRGFLYDKCTKQSGTFFRVHYSNCKTASKRHGNQIKPMATKLNEMKHMVIERKRSHSVFMEMTSVKRIYCYMKFKNVKTTQFLKIGFHFCMLLINFRLLMSFWFAPVICVHCADVWKYFHHSSTYFAGLTIKLFIKIIQTMVLHAFGKLSAREW